MTDEYDYEAKATDNGITLRAPEHQDLLAAASTAATLIAENIEGRHGEHAGLARSLRTASRFANDVMKFDAAYAAGDEEHPPAEGQYADVILLHMATAGWASTLSHPPNKGGHIEATEEAADFLMRVESTLIRVLGIRAVGGRMGEVPYRYGDGKQTVALDAAAWSTVEAALEAPEDGEWVGDAGDPRHLLELRDDIREQRAPSGGGADGE